MYEFGVWDVIHKNLAIDGNYVGLYGPPGTGKTYAAARYGLREDAAIIEVNCADGTVEYDDNAVALFSITMTDGASEAELRGHYIPTAEGGQWIDGPATLAWKMSHYVQARLIINEIDRASDEVLSMLYAIADDPTSPGTMLTLPNERKERIRPGRFFTIVATMNGTPEDLPEALQDRFAWIAVNEVNPEALAVLPDDLRPHAASAALAEGERRVSIRRWLKFAQLEGHGMDRNMAAYTAFGHDRYRDVLDSIGVAKIVARVSALPPKGTVNNPHFDNRFSSHEDIDTSGDYYCGWCHAPGCGNSDGECTPMRFVDETEFQDFCAAWDVPSDDSTASVRLVWAASMLRRTYSRQMTVTGVKSLVDSVLA